MTSLAHAFSPTHRPRIALLARTFARAALAASLAWAAVPGQAADALADHARESQQTRDVATRYFDAYIAMRWDEVAPLLAERATFKDPTAIHVFGGQEHVGKAALMKLFREDYAGIVDMHFAPLRRMASGQHAVFEGDLAWTIRLKDGRLVSSVTPIVTTVHVENGLVTEHVDLVDYQPFLAEVARTRPAPAKP